MRRVRDNFSWQGRLFFRIGYTSWKFGSSLSCKLPIYIYICYLHVCGTEGRWTRVCWPYHTSKHTAHRTLENTTEMTILVCIVVQAAVQLRTTNAASRGALRYPEAPGLQHYSWPPYPRKRFLFFFLSFLTIIMSNFNIFFLLICQLTFTTLFCVYKWICKFPLCHKEFTGMI